MKGARAHRVIHTRGDAVPLQLEIRGRSNVRAAAVGDFLRHVNDVASALERVNQITFSAIGNWGGQAHLECFAASQVEVA